MQSNSIWLCIERQYIISAIKTEFSTTISELNPKGGTRSGNIWDDPEDALFTVYPRNVDWANINYDLYSLRSLNASCTRKTKTPLSLYHSRPKLTEFGAFSTAIKLESIVPRLCDLSELQWDSYFKPVLNKIESKLLE